MEIIKGVQDVAFVLLFTAIVTAPRAISTYLAIRKREHANSLVQCIIDLQSISSLNLLGVSKTVEIGAA
jgi:hypothetical protein